MPATTTVAPSGPGPGPTGASVMVVPALQVHQNTGRTLWLFAVDGKRLDDIADVARATRADLGVLEGYQRGEVARHIASISAYIESDRSMIPNGLVIAFDSTVTFTPTGPPPGGDAGSWCVPGTVTIPINPDGSPRAGLIVDGQQRTAAIRAARVEQFPVSVVGFVPDDDDDQRAQFVLVNSTRPLPRSLIHELLPGIDAALPRALSAKRVPAALVERVNFDPRSPLCGRIKTPTNPYGYLSDTAFLNGLAASLTDGWLYALRDPRDGTCDVDTAFEVLCLFWSAVRDVFPLAWDMRPDRSRLTHGAGIRALCAVADAIVDDYPCRDGLAGDIAAGLRRIAGRCAWTSGSWEFADGTSLPWNGIENTGTHIAKLSRHLTGPLTTPAGVPR